VAAAVHARADWLAGDHEPDTMTTLPSVHDGSFELEQVSPDLVRRAIGGAEALREPRRRLRNARATGDGRRGTGDLAAP
jgi:hypothetical protein